LQGYFRIVFFDDFFTVLTFKFIDESIY